MDSIRHIFFHTKPPEVHPSPMQHVLQETSKKKLCSRDQRSGMLLCFLPSGPFYFNSQFSVWSFGVGWPPVCPELKEGSTLKDLTAFCCGREWRCRVSSRDLQGEWRMEEKRDSSMEESWSSNALVYRLMDMNGSHVYAIRRYPPALNHQGKCVSYGFHPIMKI